MRAGNFLQNLWFNDEEGGESPPVHIRFSLFIKVEQRKMLSTSVQSALSLNN